MTQPVINGMLTKQLIPINLGRIPNKTDFRYVAICVEPLETAGMAYAHLSLAPSGCVVACERGPKGGWTDARYIEAHMLGGAITFERMLARRGRTLYYGWKYDSNPLAPGARPRILPTVESWMATLQLHA